MHSAYILGYKPRFKIKIEHRLKLKLLTRHIYNLDITKYVK